MTDLELATEFVTRFCAGRMGQLGELLTDDFRLAGPMGTWGKQGYLAALASDPPVAGSAHVLSAVADQNEVALLYEYRHGTTATVVGQTFWVSNGLIRRSLVAFGPDGSV